MTDKNLIEETAEALGLKELTPEIYKDLLQPASREAGKALLTTAKTVSIALAPLEAVNWGYHECKQWLAAKVTQKLSNIPPSDIQSPSMNIAGPAALNLYFSYDQEQLRNMYAHLISSSMKTATSSTVHPAFVSIIQQLLAEEALILEAMYKVSESGSRLIGNRIREGDIDNPFKSHPDDWATDIIFDICQTNKLELKIDLKSSLQNLIRLKIISIETESESEYVPEYGDRKGVYGPEINLHLSDSLSFTDFGIRFVESCIEIDNMK